MKIQSKMRGNLVRILPSGKEQVIVHNEIWAVLQQRKALLIRQGCQKDTLKLKYISL